MVSVPHVYFAQGIKERMLQVASRYENVETGGLILGKVRRGPSGTVFFVAQISGPGPQARCRPHAFEPDMAFYRRFIKKNAKLDYLGEWHKHPVGHAWLSTQDLSQARRIFDSERQPELLCPLLVPHQQGRGVVHYELHCFYIHQRLDHFLQIPYSLLTPKMLDALTAPVLNEVLVEEAVIRKFLASAQRSRVVSACLHPQDKIIQIYQTLKRPNTQALLIRSAVEPYELNIPADISLYLTIADEAPLKVRAYWLAPLNDMHPQEVSCRLLRPRAGVFVRNAQLPVTRALQRKRVTLIGLGSIGSNAAMELARAGIGDFTLIDPDTIELSNLCRHLCDLSDVGRLKVRAVADRLTALGTAVKVRAQPLDITKNPSSALQSCRRSHLLFVTTDTERSRRLANWISHELKIPAIYAGAMENADGGRIWRVVPGVTACYACHPGLDALPLNRNIPYSRAQNERDLSVQPGLGNDIAFITHIAVRYAIETLKSPKSLKIRTLPYNLTFWFNRKRDAWDIGPLELVHVPEVPVGSKCEFCVQNTPPASTAEV